MDRTTSGRQRELDLLLVRCQHQWRDFFYELENGDASLLSEDPWHGLDEFLARLEPEHRAGFKSTLEEMIRGGDAVEQAQALSIVAACREPFDLAVAVAMEPALRSDLEAHLALILAIGQRRFDAGRSIVDAAVADATRQHAGRIALAQLDPAAAAACGAQAWSKDRASILATLARPLDEHEYATFYQMAEGVLQLHGKEGLNEFLRAVAAAESPADDTTVHHFSQLARRLLQQADLAGS
jgi:hypothetical protein